MIGRCAFPVWLGLSWLALTAATVPSVEEIRAWHALDTRIQTIGWKILAANVDSCTARRADFGLTSASPNLSASAELQAAWQAAMQLKDGSTIIMVVPGSPAAQAGLHVGDAIISVSGIGWQNDPEGRRRFAEALVSGLKTAHLDLMVRTTGTSEPINVAIEGRQICDARLALTSAKVVNAQANGSNIFVTQAIAKLLASDDELAFVIAHEVAHVVLGHSDASSRDKVRKSALRHEMEKDADALGIRLMLRAGYDPDAAARAHPRIAQASRGPISRLLDLHGSYMATGERIDFLRAQAEEARKEAAVR